MAAFGSKVSTDGMRSFFNSVTIMWALFAIVVGWGSYVLARRDPRSTSWMKITFAAVPLAVFGVITACFFLLPPGTLGEGLLLHGTTIFFFWPMAVIGAPVCVGCILGILLGMYRRQH
jgi:hypothetical protein